MTRKKFIKSVMSFGAPKYVAEDLSKAVQMYKRSYEEAYKIFLKTSIKIILEKLGMKAKSN